MTSMGRAESDRFGVGVLAGRLPRMTLHGYVFLLQCYGVRNLSRVVPIFLFPQHLSRYTSIECTSKSGMIHKLYTEPQSQRRKWRSIYPSIINRRTQNTLFIQRPCHPPISYSSPRYLAYKSGRRELCLLLRTLSTPTRCSLILLENQPEVLEIVRCHKIARGGSQVISHDSFNSVYADRKHTGPSDKTDTTWPVSGTRRRSHLVSISGT